MTSATAQSTIWSPASFSSEVAPSEKSAHATRPASATPSMAAPAGRAGAAGSTGSDTRGIVPSRRGGCDRYPREREAGAPTPDCWSARSARLPGERGRGRLPADLRRLQGRRAASTTATSRTRSTTPASRSRRTSSSTRRASATRCRPPRPGASAGRCPTAAPEEDVAPTVSAGTPAARRPRAQEEQAVAEPPAPEVALPASTDLAAPQLVPAAASVSSDTPGALIALLVAAGLAVALALAWTVAWFMGWSPERLTKPRICGVSEYVGPLFHPEFVLALSPPFRRGFERPRDA